ncbi:PLP-dependent transferase [Mycena sanguinolenta]|nr:PLP-dependent transferase [Mycena sanguinolenta]
MGNTASLHTPSVGGALTSLSCIQFKDASEDDTLGEKDSTESQSRKIDGQLSSHPSPSVAYTAQSDPKFQSRKIDEQPSSHPSPDLQILDAAAAPYKQFLDAFPEYKLTWMLDTLRLSDYQRLDAAGETYTDYMGGAIYPESLIRVHTNFLSHNVLGNTHSINNSSELSSRCSNDARAAVLQFFSASPDEYTVVFTPNATGALRVVGESFPFTEDSSYILGADSHNSVHGIREYATRRGARVCYIPTTKTGGFDAPTAHRILSEQKSDSPETAPCLFVMTGQSNITNSKTPKKTISEAASLGYYTVLDAAALAATSTISLTEWQVDAMVVSFYKMFGFPTGVGALIAKKSFLRRLDRPWFAGGTVNVVQVPGTIVTRSDELHEQFEDGTINYLALSAITNGLRFLSAYLPFLPLRLSCLVHHLTSSLSAMKHDTTRGAVVRVLSATPSRRLRSVGAQSDVGSVVSLIFLTPSAEVIPNSFIEYVATRMCISLRTGCMCNTGGAAAMLGKEAEMEQLFEGARKSDIERVIGHEFGVVRISLGLASNFQDVWNVIRFVELLGQDKMRRVLWEAWVSSPAKSH